MKIKGILVKGLITAGVALTIAALAVLSIPLFLDRVTIRDEATKRLSAWAGGQIEIGGPIDISYFPDISLEASNVTIKNIQPLREIQELKTDRLRARLNWFPLLLGKIEIGELTLDRPRVQTTSDVILSEKTKDNKPYPFPTIFSLLNRSSVGRLIIRDATLEILKEDGLREEIKELNAQLSIPGDGVLTGHGTLTWRAQKLDFKLTTDSPETNSATAIVPTQLKINNSLIKADLEGELTFADGFQLQGKLDLMVTDMRKLARWLDYPLASGRGLGEFRANGIFTWQGRKIAFSKANYTLDGNSADGALSLDFDGDKPQIDGTLAMQQLIISHYLGPNIDSDRTIQNRSMLNRPINLSLLNQLDIDLRLSTGKIGIADLNTGRCAFTLSLKSGKLQIDFAELEIFDGLAIGHAEINPAAALNRFTINATLTQVMTEQLFGTISNNILLTGPADIELNVTAEGRSPEHLLRSLGGKFRIDMVNGGQANLALSKMLDDVRQNASMGWGNAANGKTGFEKLNASMELKNGEAHSRNFHITTSQGIVTGSGMVDIPSKSMKWNLIITGTENSDSTSGPRTDSELLFSGPWTQPQIRLKEKLEKDRQSIHAPALAPQSRPIDDKTIKSQLHNQR